MTTWETWNKMAGQMSNKWIMAEELNEEYQETWMTDDGEQGAVVSTGYDHVIDSGVFYVEWDNGIMRYTEWFPFLHEAHEFLEAKGFELYEVMGAN